MFARMAEDIRTIMAHDPAARSRLEVVLCYPGFHAVVLCTAFAHLLWRCRLKLISAASCPMSDASSPASKSIPAR